MKKVQNSAEIDNFLNAITNMLESKYILVDRKISDILYAIANNDLVYNTIAQAMINFDFKQEWADAITPAFIKLPEDADKRIAFIFCFLNNIDDKNLDITQILDKYYSYDSMVAPYELFCRNIILEFKQLILRKLGMNDVPEVVFSGTPVNPEEYSLLASMLHDFADYLMIQKKIKRCYLNKENLVAIVSTFEEVAKNRQSEYFYSYRIMINSAIYKNKELKEKFKNIDGLAEKIAGERL